MKETELNKDILTIAKGAGTNLSGVMVATIIGYVYSIVLARNIGSELIGVYFIVMSIMAITIPFSKIGLDSGVLRYTSMYYGVKDFHRIKGTIIGSMGIGIVLSSFTGTILFIYSEKIVIYLGGGNDLSFAIRLLSLTLPLLVIISISLSFTQAFREMKYRVYVNNLFIPVSKLCIIVFLFILGYKFAGVIYAEISSVLIGAVFAVYFLRRFFPRSKEIKAIFEAKDIVKYSSPIFLTGFLIMINGNIDALMLGYFRSPIEVGIYRVALKTALFGDLILNSFNAIFAPIVSDLSNRKEYGKLSSLYKLTTRWIFLLTIPLLLMMILFSRPILGIFGSEFIAGSSILIILCISQITNISVGSAGLLLKMGGRTNILLINTACVCIINFMLNLFLIPKYGAYGAALATVISIFSINVIRLIEVYKIWKIHPYEYGFLKPLFACIIVFLLFMQISERVGLHNPVLLVLSIISFFIVYLIIVLMLKMSPEDYILINHLKNKLAVVKLF
jgi:O-antigen/teichoic acid export membrane protein